VWVVGDAAVGPGVRKDDDRVTSNTSRLFPYGIDRRACDRDI